MSRLFRLTSPLLLLTFLIAPSLLAGGKVGVYGLRQVPDGDDAENYSKAGWGGGIHVTAPMPQFHNIYAFVGVSFAMLSK